MLESGKDTAINHQIESIKALSKDVEKSCCEVKLQKITKGEDEIPSWNAGIEQELRRQMTMFSSWRIGRRDTNKTKNLLCEKSS